MKKISILMFAFVAALCFNACVEDEEPTFVIQEEQTEGPQITSANAIVNLDEERKDETVFTMHWNDAAYNINTPITYNIEAGLGGTSFETILEDGAVIATTNDRFYSWTIGELNNLAIELGVEPLTEGAIDFRIVSTIGTNSGSGITSNVTSITLTPYPTILPVKNLFLVGNSVDTNKDGIANNDDWDNGSAAAATNTYIFRDADNENVFHFRGYFSIDNGNEFKLLETQGEWQPQWGLDGGGFTSSDILGGDPGAFTVAASGYYDLMVNIDPEGLTYTFTPFTITTEPTYGTIGIIGASRTGDDSGWNAPDTDMNQSPFNPHIWYLEGVDLFDGPLKFRHSDDWPGNWGGATPLTGVGITDGDPPAIEVTAGKYDIWFNDLDGRYLLVPVE